MFNEGHTAWTLSPQGLVGQILAQIPSSPVQRGHPPPQPSHTGTCLLWLYRWVAAFGDWVIQFEHIKV